MTALFIAILNMSISASVVALAVIIVRIPMKKVPKIFSYALWVVVLFRLICPFSFESAFSLMPASSTAIPQDIVYSQNPSVDTGIQFVDMPINTAISNALPTISPENSINPIHIVLYIAAYVWLFGFVALLLYATIGYIRLKRRVYYAIRLRENIYESDKINTPFVFGFIHPKIYMPIGIEPPQHDYVVKHEQTHIRRRDYLIKPFAFIVFSLHWFNPLMWAAYFLMSKDIEMSCDEAVLKKTDGDIRVLYSSSLLNLSVKRGSLLLTPLAFGESGVKERVKNVLNFKKPATWIIVVSLLMVSIFLIGFASNPASGSSINNNDNSALDATKLTMKDIYRACPETAVDEIVNDEVISLLTDMYNNNEYLHMQKRLEWVYPYKNIDKESFEWLIDLLNEYEWRANRATSGFEASDFDLFIEFYTPDMACVLTFYGKYDIILYQDKINNITAYYTYVLTDDSIYADLAGRLNMFYDNSVYSYSPMYSTQKDNETAVSPVRENSSNENLSGMNHMPQMNSGDNVPDESPVAINGIGIITDNAVLSIYIANGGLSQVVLKENNEFFVQGRPEISYNPTGSYEIDGNKLYLNVSENQQFIFSIDGNSLIFESGEWLENWIAKETVFTLLEDAKVTRNMTLDDVRVLAARGEALTVADFDSYRAESSDETGIYAPTFIIDDAYTLCILGSHVSDNVNFQIILTGADDIKHGKEGIDIRYYDVDKYVRDGTRELIRVN